MAYNAIYCLSSISIAIECALCICSSQLSSLELLIGEGWLVGGFLGIASACSTRPMMKIFSIPCLSMVTVLGSTSMM